MLIIKMPYSIPILLLLVYQLLAIKVIYEQNWFWSAVKMLCFNLLYVVVALPLFIILVFLVSALS
jgi:hypothetical protein